MKVIFVCTGNTCRSPMAEGILRHLAPDIDVESRGIFAVPGTRTSEQTRLLLNQRLGLDLDHMARQLADEDCAQADLVLTMTRAQADFVRNLTDCAQVLTLNEFAGSPAEVADPYGQSGEAYEATFSQLMDLITAALARIRREFLT